MSPGSWILLAVLASSLLPGLVIFAIAERRVALRTSLNLLGAVSKLLLVGWMLWGVAHGHAFELRLALLPGLDFVLRAGPLALLFVTLSSALWLLTTLYAIGYLEGSPHRSRFFGFFSLCVTASVGVALAGNLLTFLLFYELLTLSTYPLVVHRGTEAARRAGQRYLAYTLTGGALLLIGTLWLYSLAGTLEFTATGFVHGLVDSHRGALTLIFWLLIAGVGVKAALVPLHGWLPQAMVAPAPVSALLHAVAVVKAGAFGIVRIVYEVYGVELAADLGLALPLAVLASITILYGSLRALYQDDLKRRLAFSTVSQVSYIALGVAIAGPIATIGGLVHLVHQGLMKITLFFCAGNLAETVHIHRISEMDGVGRRMPWTMGAFTLAAFGMIGLPPMAGFVSKWYLGLGAMQAGQDWVVLVLAGSSLLNAAYFLPILHRAWFRAPAGNGFAPAAGGRETGWLLLWPPVITAAMSLGAGMLAFIPFSPLEWVQFIARQEFIGYD
ncbi:formate hydrogenlyase subunit 3/Multisubunit Na+ /H+ antiporter, MnhD subunit [Thiohalobacter thiocyanaticus]|uniref:Formate hydrogenlyase subunit 3/Multisubunit Na+ /H+ antiporter, MnhD subunit n=1 Tax=Thiohalobacter thiocyanaticus TaxID=585455 RepID=A0A1Z4VMX2_9GAMM|nr:proton-conducting transporter membrane subunit [Thiohalobacter thiocyanaticus]BAZ92853.1 formate hydrogenlyase subunit 3/Multisubunit Na+ /H+ antiporter, MnhD subunit [Thiohalobacter thiocyanaticus]